MADVSQIGAGGAAYAAADGAPQAAPNDQFANKEMFLELLVAQIRHQNPLSPSDPKDFLAQLSQFSGVEQMVSMRRELEAIHGALDAQSALLEKMQAAAETPAADRN